MKSGASMTGAGRGIRLAVVMLFATGMIAVAGCTKYASPDDLKNLDAANKAAVSAETDLQKAKAERADLEKQVVTKQAELDAAKGELEKVKSR